MKIIVISVTGAEISQFSSNEQNTMILFWWKICQLQTLLLSEANNTHIL